MIPCNSPNEAWFPIQQWLGLSLVHVVHTASNMVVLPLFPSDVYIRPRGSSVLCSSSIMVLYQLVFMIYYPAITAAAILSSIKTDSPPNGAVSESENWSPTTQAPLHHDLLKREAPFRTCGYRRGDQSMYLASFAYRTESLIPFMKMRFATTTTSHYNLMKLYFLC